MSVMISMIMVSNIILAGVVVFMERRDVGSTWAWLMVLFFIPVLGFIFYIFIGRQLKHKHFYDLTREEKIYFETRVAEELAAIDELKYDKESLIGQYSDVIKMNLRSSSALLTTDNEIQVFHDGKDKFESLFRDIRQAKKEIHVQYYIIQPDSLGKQLRDELIQKAKEGVKVRLLYDEVGSKRLPRSFFQELTSHGGQVEIFFPSFLRLFNFRINNRNHRKLCVIDGEIGYIGGFNVGEEYLGLDQSMGYWRDTHFRVQGEAVNHIQGRFMLDWRLASKASGEETRLFANRTERCHGYSPVQIIASGPNSQTEHLKNLYIKLIATAKHSVHIQTPYFIPDSSFMDACKIALLSGVDVQIMIPNKPDQLFVYWATWSNVGELLPYGAKIFLYEKGFLHAKTIIVDQTVASVGTTNVDNRSFKLNFEINAIVYDTDVAKRLYDLFVQDMQVCTELTTERYEARGRKIKLREAVSRLLSPLL
jgi:cardiolipin synthase A/B